MVNGIECLGIVDSDCSCPGGRFPLIKPHSDRSSKGKESGGGRVLGFKPVLRGVYWEGRGEGGEKKSLKNFRGRAEKRDGTVRGTQLGWFTSLLQRNNDGVLP